jgi:rare lipoprotein A
MKKTITLFLLLTIVALGSSQSAIIDRKKTVAQKAAVSKTTMQKDSVKKIKSPFAQLESIPDSLFVESEKFKSYKKEANASYYADKFNGKRTTSGTRFDNNKYTAAHRKLPFGTRVKVTNIANGKSVVVEITDRGPFSRGREIDLSKRAFREIASNKISGVMLVSIAVIED